MINYNPKNWFTLIFQRHMSQSMRFMFPNQVILGVYTAIICYIFTEVVEAKVLFTMEIHKLLGIVLGLVLVFRTNTAYDRWWEGRKLFGALVNHSRSFALKCAAIEAPQAQRERAFFASAIANFARALVWHLRNKAHDMPVRENSFLSEARLKSATHIPNRIINEVQQKLHKLLGSGAISGEQYLSLTRETDGLIDVMGGCERILKTPIPFSYSIYFKKVIFIYVITLPFGFLQEFRYWTIPAVMFIFYVLVGIELIAEEIEDPFGTDQNDLPTDEIAINIEKNVDEILGQ